MMGSSDEDAPPGDTTGALDPDTAKLVQEGKLLRVLRENMSVILYAIDRRGVITYQEGKGLAVIGFEPGQLVGANVSELHAGSQELEHVKAALQGELCHFVAGERGTSWEHWLIPVRDDHGEVTSVVGFALDLTNIRRAEQELRAQLALVERQQQMIRAMSTPIIEVWDKVLTLPMVGLVDSARAAEVMENLLGQVSRKGARFAIIDLTGVAMVDTGLAARLVQMIHALRLLGAEGIITGIQPDLAQAMVAQGFDLTSIVTLANLRDALRLCIKRMGEGPIARG